MRAATPSSASATTTDPTERKIPRKARAQAPVRGLLSMKDNMANKAKQSAEPPKALARSICRFLGLDRGSMAEMLS